ncbi:MAG: VPLPA-CTERM sorting domain-containing protein [Pseudomonadota bacterium]
MEFTRLSLGSLEQIVSFDLDIGSDGLVRMTSRFKGDSEFLEPYSWDISLSFTDPGILVTGVSDVMDDVFLGSLVGSFTKNSVTLSLKSEPFLDGRDAIRTNTGETASLQIVAESPMSAVPLPAGLPLLLTGLAALGLYSRRRG